MLNDMADGSESHERERVLQALAADSVFLARYVEFYKVGVTDEVDIETGKEEAGMYTSMKDVV